MKRGEKGRKGHPQEHSLKLSRAKAGRARVSRGGHPTPTHASAGTKPTLCQGLSPLPIPGRRSETATGKLPRHSSPASQRGTKTKRDFSILFSHVKSIGNHCAHPSLYTFLVGTPQSSPVTRHPPADLWSSEPRHGYFGRVGPFPDWSSHRGRGDHSDPVRSGAASSAPRREQVYPLSPWPGRKRRGVLQPKHRLLSWDPARNSC